MLSDAAVAPMGFVLRRLHCTARCATGNLVKLEAACWSSRYRLLLKN